MDPHSGGGGMPPNPFYLISTPPGTVNPTGISPLGYNQAPQQVSGANVDAQMIFYTPVMSTAVMPGNPGVQYSMVAPPSHSAVPQLSMQPPGQAVGGQTVATSSPQDLLAVYGGGITMPVLVPTWGENTGMVYQQLTGAPTTAYAVMFHQPPQVAPQSAPLGMPSAPGAAVAAACSSVLEQEVPTAPATQSHVKPREGETREVQPSSSHARVRPAARSRSFSSDTKKILPTDDGTARSLFPEAYRTGVRGYWANPSIGYRDVPGAYQLATIPPAALPYPPWGRLPVPRTNPG